MIERLLPAGLRHQVRVRCSDRSDGDFHVDAPEPGLSARRRQFAPGPWTWLHQVHGSRVVAVDAPGERAGERADGSVTSVIGAVLAVQSADCVPVVLAAPGVVAVAHAGWRGVVEGVIPTAVAAVRGRTTDSDASPAVHAFVGAHIRAAHYAFGAAELDAVAAVAGDDVRGVTVDGDPALDMTVAVRSVLEKAGVVSIEIIDDDTADPAWFSHRRRSDGERQVTAAWLEPIGEGGS